MTELATYLTCYTVHPSLPSLTQENMQVVLQFLFHTAARHRRKGLQVNYRKVEVRVKHSPTYIGWTLCEACKSFAGGRAHIGRTIHTQTAVGGAGTSASTVTDHHTGLGFH